jgi:hypothetical protein
MSAFLGRYLNIKAIAVVFMMRDINEILASEKRINWNFGEEEISRYPSAFRNRVETMSMGSAELKYAYWKEFQKGQINAFEVEYSSVAETKYWIPPEKRLGFEARQWKEADTIETVFTSFYEDPTRWKHNGTVCGEGSTKSYTSILRPRLTELIDRLGGISSIVDIGCGDFNWMQLVLADVPIFSTKYLSNHGRSYLGLDVIKPMIAKNVQEYPKTIGCFDIAFEVCNIVTGVPKRNQRGELVICRDVLFHLSYPQAFGAIANILKIASRYVMFSSHPNGTNSNIQTGFFYFQNLLEPPFNFPRPLLLLTDYVEPWQSRWLCLWTVEAMREWEIYNKEEIDKWLLQL